MSRAAWSRLFLVPAALACLALASCLHDAGDCPTCPGVASSSIEVLVPRDGLVDSIHVRLDGGAQVTVRRDRRHAYEDLTAGMHEVAITRWLSIDGVVTSRASTLRIELDRGETRFIVFHNDFPLVAWAPSRDAGAVAGRGVRERTAPRVG